MILASASMSEALGKRLFNKFETASKFLSDVCSNIEFLSNWEIVLMYKFSNRLSTVRLSITKGFEEEYFAELNIQQE